MTKIHTEIVINDIHIPNENKKAVNCVIQVIKDLQPDGITLNGDIGDWSTFSRHNRFIAPKQYWNDTDFYNVSEHEYNALNNFLDRITKASQNSRVRFANGNHEVWVESFVSESPKTRKEIFGISQRLKFKQREFEVYKYNSFMKLGKLRVTHGIYTGNNHAKKHVEAMGTSILYGHLHDIQVYSKVTPEKVSHMGWCNGCLCNMNPDYLRNRPQNWNHGFAIVYVWPSGEFQVDLIRINEGKCVVQGIEYIG